MTVNSVKTKHIYKYPTEQFILILSCKTFSW